MPNFQVIDAYGSVITIQSSTFGTAERQIVGTIGGGQSGTVISSIVSITPSSVLVGASIFGQLPAGTAPIGSVATLQGTVPWIISSVYGNVSGSVVTIQSGTVIGSVIGAIAPTGTVTSVQATASTLNLLAANTGRRGATVGNYSATSVLVKLGLMSGVNDHTVLLQNQDYYEVPFNYSGVIQHFSSSTAGMIRITEVT